MEKAVFVVRPESLALAKNGYGRLYFGQEFCDRLIPSKDALKEAVDHAGKASMAFTLVTPYLTEEQFPRWVALAEALEGLLGDFEIVINDWGFLRKLRSLGTKHPYLLGRLLSKQKRGPQILRILDKVPATMVDHFRRSTSDVPVTVEFLKKMGFRRIELDNLLHGIERENELPASIYYPYGYITTTRLCLSNSCTNRTESLRAIFPCGRECQKLHFSLSHKDMPVTVTLAGNSQFFVNEKLPGELEKLSIDRLVHEPEIPL
ncbi:MAG: hypothetical protein RDV48_28525 [Candidatus Eremiobacteraeota bacterium]|nr:hypothetical protein [Candidatus Eremiobacteraeota bacterium]